MRKPSLNQFLMTLKLGADLHARVKRAAAEDHRSMQNWAWKKLDDSCPPNEEEKAARREKADTQKRIAENEAARLRYIKTLPPLEPHQTRGWGPHGAGTGEISIRYGYRADGTKDDETKT